MMCDCLFFATLKMCALSSTHVRLHKKVIIIEPTRRFDSERFGLPIGALPKGDLSLHEIEEYRSDTEFCRKINEARKSRQPSFIE
jgi:hypothetical protein